MHCRDCVLWVAPKPMDPEAEAVAVSRGVNRDGACHLFPKTERTAADHWCGQHRPLLEKGKGP